MSARKLGHMDVSQPHAGPGPTRRLRLAAHEVRFRKSGIEFRAPTAIPPWTEMTVELEAPSRSGKFQSTGVVVACTGNPQAGFQVSVLFPGLSRQAQARLQALAISALA